MTCFRPLTDDVVDAYLRRLGCCARPPSAHALLELHAAHVERVPYETTWIHLGEARSTDALESAVTIATRGRGGYCFHLNGAFGALLHTLGYRVGAWIGGVHDDAIELGDRGNHLVLVVDGSGGDTGFTRDEWMVKGHWGFDCGCGGRHDLRLKLGYSDEESNETYLGLADGDFERTPYRRYAASKLDHMSWTRTQIALTHSVRFDADVDVSTTLYRNQIHRIWRKVNGFRDRAVDDVLSDPTSGQNAPYYGVLTGRVDSSRPGEAIMIGPNDRNFDVYGAQTTIKWTPTTGPIKHRIEYSVRAHFDRIVRKHTQDAFLVTNGLLVPEGSPTQTTASNDAHTTALAMYVTDAATWGRLTVMPGLRVEAIHASFKDDLAKQSDGGSYQVFLPGVGAYYGITKELGVLGGVYRGFSPAPPEAVRKAGPEDSVNYEGGLRWSSGKTFGGLFDSLRAEAIGFLNDYYNLTSICTLSSGCGTNELDQQFEAGGARVWGLELFTQAEPRLDRNFTFPIRGSYTYTNTQFLNDFKSGDPTWGNVKGGDEFPYVPRHQASGSVGVDQVLVNGATSIQSFLLVAIPLFIVMGDLFFHSGLSKRAFDALDKLFSGVPGRLAYMTIAGGTIFAMLSGSSLASGAMLGSVMLPEARRRGYKNYLAIGPILGSGGLAILIPPSALMVVLGSIARVDVGSLLLAGVIPGFGLAALYVILVFVMLKIDPSAAPAYDVPKTSVAEKLRVFATDLMPLLLVVFAVIGTILLGFATPSESAAFGVLAVVILMFAYRCFSWNVLVAAIDSALRVSVMVFLIIVGSATFSQILAYSGATGALVEWATGYHLNAYLMVTVMFLVLLVLGCFVDAISIMMLTIPIFYPIVNQIGVSPVLFGVVMMISLEIGAITPPFGLLLFVMHGVARGQASMQEIVMASLPFLGCAALMVILLMIYPPIALYLPGLAK